jgi:uncharacterized membrane protein
VGIVMPGFVSPAAAAMSALLLVPDAAPAAAFVAGTIGPLIGAAVAFQAPWVMAVAATAVVGGRALHQHR